MVIGQDFEPLCVEMMKANGYNVLGRDIGKIKPETLLERIVLHVGEPFMVCGETLCQPFSSAWKRLGINDPRGSLFMDFIRMIDYIRLRFFAMENVKGIVSSPLKHVSTKEFSDDWKFAGTISAQYRQIGNAVPIGLAEAIW